MLPLLANKDEYIMCMRNCVVQTWLQNETH